MTTLPMVWIGHWRPLPMGDQSDRTRGGAGGSCDLQTNPLEVCSTAETAEASLS